MTSLSYTLPQWLTLRAISRAQWYRLTDKPDVYGKGRMQRISSEADARWLRARTQSQTTKQSCLIEHAREQFAAVFARVLSWRQSAKRTK